MRRVEADSTPNTFPVDFEFIELFSQNMNLSYDSVDHDQMPLGRTKMTHPVGVHAHVEWVPALNPDNNYTGLFEKGCNWGFMRISETLKTDPMVAHTAPGFGFKCFVEQGNPSLNLTVMFDLDG